MGLNKQRALKPKPDTAGLRGARKQSQWGSEWVAGHSPRGPDTPFFALHYCVPATHTIHF
eukprot:scaffold59741_cov12-Tisochrysis_lutea.AAC.1